SCNTQVFDSGAQPVSGSGSTVNASSGNFSNPPAGTYRWRAFYSGDANYTPNNTPCNDTNETSTVNKFTPTVSTNATNSAAIGSSISDQATVSGGSSPSGDVTFKAYGPSDPTCANSPAYTSATNPLSGGTASNAPPFTPSNAGTYRWRGPTTETPT